MSIHIWTFVMFLLLCCLCYRNDLYPRWQLLRSSSPPLWSMMMRVLVSSATRTWTIMTPAVSAVGIVSILTYVYIPSLPPSLLPPPTHTHTDTYTHRHMSKHTAQYNYSTTKFISSSLVKKNLFASTCCILVVILSGCKTCYDNQSILPSKTTSGNLPGTRYFLVVVWFQIHIP